MNKSGMISITIACTAMLTPSAQAQTRGGFEARAEVFDYSYRERQDGQVVVRDDGIFGGIGIGYVETIGGGAFLRGRLSAAAGSVDYRSDGSVLDEPGASESRLDNVSQSIGQLEFHLGKDFPVGGVATITPFVGLGSRYLSDNSGGEETEDGLLGYDREISYGYVPLGVEASVPVGDRSALKLAAQYNWVVGGTATSHFSDVAEILPDVGVDLDGGRGFEASAMLGMPVGRSQLSFGPFIRTWNIGQSKSFLLTDPEAPGEAIEFYEPKNSTTQLGVRLSFAF